MTQARQHRGSLIESMETVEPARSLDELVARIRRDLSAYGVRVDAQMVHVEPYMYDARIGWDTHLVTVDGYGVWGMADGPA